MQMEKLLVNDSLFSSEVALIQIFGFLAHPMDGSLMLFFQCLRRALRRAAFLSWRGCYLHGKMLYVCSQSSSHRISQGSLTEKAMCASLKRFSQVLAQQHPFKSLVNYIKCSISKCLATLLFWYKKVKKSLARLLACMRKHPLQETCLSGNTQTLGSVPQSAAPRNKESVGWTCTSLCTITANCWAAAACGKALNAGCWSTSVPSWMLPGTVNVLPNR